MLDQKIDIQHIGQQNSWEVISQSWIPFCAFNNKVIVDFWCGVSDLLFTILESSEPKALYGIDPIFESEDTLENAKNDLHTYLNDFLNLYKKRPGGLPEVREKLHRRLDVLSRFPHDDSISYQSNISIIEEWTVDYLFINFLLYAVDNKVWFINELLKYLNTSGKIIITDISSIGKNLNSKNLKVLHQDYAISTLEITRI